MKLCMLFFLNSFYICAVANHSIFGHLTQKSGQGSKLWLPLHVITFIRCFRSVVHYFHFVVPTIAQWMIFWLLFSYLISYTLFSLNVVVVISARWPIFENWLSFQSSWYWMMLDWCLQDSTKRFLDFQSCDSETRLNIADKTCIAFSLMNFLKYENVF